MPETRNVELKNVVYKIIVQDIDGNRRYTIVDRNDEPVKELCGADKKIIKEVDFCKVRHEAVLDYETNSYVVCIGGRCWLVK